MTQAPLTRDQKLKSKQKWDISLGLVAKEFKTLEAWVLEIPRNTDLTKHLRVEVSETEAKWAAQEKIEVLATLQESWEEKLLYIPNLLGNLEEEVVNTPTATAQDEEDTRETRQFNLRAQDRVYYEAKQVFIRWKITFQRSKELFKDLLAAFKTKDKAKQKPRVQEQEVIPQTEPKMSPQPMLETSFPSMQMKDWYRKWENYQEASGWGQEENHKTQLAYLRTVVSDEIRMAISFDGMNTVARAIYEIKRYLNMAVMPLTLQR